MGKPHIHAVRRPISASEVLRCLGDSIGRIRQEDSLTWEDMGRFFGKSGDTVARYADGSADMPVSAYYFGKQSLNGRFTGEADKLIESHQEISAHQAQSCILKAALALAVALEDGDLSLDEIRANRSTLQNARDAIDAQLALLKPRELRR